MIAMAIPYDFMSQRIDLTWRDVKYGLDRQLITPEVAIDKAQNQLTGSHEVGMDVVELAGRSRTQPVTELVARLADAENEVVDDTQAKWLYLALAWLFDNRGAMNDPLGLVEEIYSDFGYPHEIAPLVRYMPMVGPDLGSSEKNVTRLYDSWKSYLDEAGKRFARPVRHQ